MCDFAVDFAELIRDYGMEPARDLPLFQSAAEAFGDLVVLSDTGFRIIPEGRPLTRMVARAFDAYDPGTAKHSAAI